VDTLSLHDALPICQSMKSYSKHWIAVAVVATVAALSATGFFMMPKAESLQLTDVKEITLSPTDVAIPRVELNRVKRETKYLCRLDGDQYRLYFIADGTHEDVLGDLPKLTSTSDLSGFTDVMSLSGIITYAFYTKYEAAPLGASKLVASELYALRGNRAQKILANIKPGGINSLDKRIPLAGAYLDDRGNLYVLTLDAMLCVVRNGQVVAKADVSEIGAKRPAIPTMFSDVSNTYFLVPKLSDRDNSMTGFGPVSESQIKGKYKVNLPR
jgi:hypothetical protein